MSNNTNFPHNLSSKNVISDLINNPIEQQKENLIQTAQFEQQPQTQENEIQQQQINKNSKEFDESNLQQVKQQEKQKFNKNPGNVEFKIQNMPQNEKIETFRDQNVNEFQNLNINNINLKHFEYIKMLGSGGFGQVSLVKERDTKYQRYLALKKINIGTTMNEQKKLRVMRETQILQQLNHPSIIKMHDYFIDQENSAKQLNCNWYLCITMDYAANGDLLQLIEKYKSEKQHIPENNIWIIAKEVCEGLSYLHSRNIIHRDIKPQNILITGSNSYKIADLGISRELSSKNQQLHTSKIGTPLYQSPELLRKQPYDFKVDIWALGCLLYFLTSLEHPFHINRQQVSPLRNENLGNGLSHKQQLEYQILNHTPKSIPELYSYKLQILIQRMLDKNQNTRPNAFEVLKLIPTLEQQQTPFSQIKFESQNNVIKTPQPSTKQLISNQQKLKNTQIFGKDMKTQKVVSTEFQQKSQLDNNIEKEPDKTSYNQYDADKTNNQMQQSTKDTENDTLNILTSHGGVKLFNRTMYDKSLFQQKLNQKGKVEKFEINISSQTNIEDQTTSQRNGSDENLQMNTYREMSLQPEISLPKFGYIRENTFSLNQKQKLSQLFQSAGKITHDKSQPQSLFYQTNGKSRHNPHQLPIKNQLNLPNQQIQQNTLVRSWLVEQRHDSDQEYGCASNLLQSQVNQVQISPFNQTSIGSFQQNHKIQLNSVNNHNSQGHKTKSQRYSQNFPTTRVYAPPINQSIILKQQVNNNRIIHNQSSSQIQLSNQGTENNGLQLQHQTISNFNTYQNYSHNPSTLDLNRQKLTTAYLADSKPNQNSMIPQLAISIQNQQETESQSNNKSHIDNFLQSIQTRRDSLQNPYHRTPQISSSKIDQSSRKSQLVSQLNFSAQSNTSSMYQARNMQQSIGLNQNQQISSTYKNNEQQLLFNQKPQFDQNQNRQNTVTGYYMQQRSNSISQNSQNQQTTQIYLQNNNNQTRTMLNDKSKQTSQQFLLINNEYQDIINTNINQIRHERQGKSSKVENNLNTYNNFNRVSQNKQQQTNQKEYQQLPKINKNIFLKTNFRNQKLTIKDLEQ